jgi:hypothetical protein
MFTGDKQVNTLVTEAEHLTGESWSPQEACRSLPLDHMSDRIQREELLRAGNLGPRHPPITGEDLGLLVVAAVIPQVPMLATL